MTRDELDRLEWDGLDVLLVSGDANVDHPSFAAPLLARHLIDRGYRTGIVSQPRPDHPEDLTVMGRPRLAVGVSAGAVDSVLARYTASRKPRSDDPYTPGGRSGARPPLATIAYTHLARRAFEDVPVIIGGIEASLRRLAHYDYWKDTIRNSILVDSGADLLVYGMGEQTLIDVLRAIENPRPHRGLKYITGTAFIGTEDDYPAPDQLVELPGSAELADDPEKLLQATLAVEAEQNPHCGRWLAQRHGDRVVIVTPPRNPLTTRQLDRLYELPFSRLPHPSYTDAVPALEPVKFSVVVNRGCFGGCSFCSLGLHQGKFVSSRSPASVMREIDRLAEHPDFRGTLTDLGGPTANMYHLAGRRAEACRACRRPSCLHPEICPNLDTDHRAFIELLKQVRGHDAVKHAFVASGIRHDLALQDPAFLDQLVQHHVGGKLKIAPEHTVDHVLALMRKPGAITLDRFVTVFQKLCRKYDKPWQLVPYMISSFPGCTMTDARSIGAYLQQHGWKLDQVQQFIPLPMTLAAAMYVAERDPDGRPIHVDKESRARRQQKKLLLEPGQGRKKKNKSRKNRNRKRR